MYEYTNRFINNIKQSDIVNFMISIINHLEYPVYPKSVMRIIITFHQKDIFRLRFSPGYETRVRISPDCPPHITILNCSDHVSSNEHIRIRIFVGISSRDVDLLVLLILRLFFRPLWTRQRTHVA